MSRRVLLDTGPLVALLNRRDRHHEWAREQFAAIEPPLLTCEAVVTEACHLVRRLSRGERVVLDVLESGIIQIAFSLEEELAPIRQLRSRYANVPMDLADACLVRMAEMHSGSPILTLDRDFAVYRMHGRRVIPLCSPRRRAEP